MEDSEEKVARISNLRKMIDHMNDKEEKLEKEEEEDLEEDEELINFLNESYEEFEIDDEYIYHPDNDNKIPVNLEENAEIDENFIIETNINEELDETQSVTVPKVFEEEIADNFDNLVNIKIGERPLLPFISLILGILFIGFSVLVYNSGTDRIIDNVSSGENSFVFVVLLIIGILLLIYSIYKIFNINNPLNSMFDSFDENNEEETLKEAEVKEEEEQVIPKSNIPLDKESYKIGEFDMNDLKNNLKSSFSRSIDKKEESPESESEINVEDIPPAREKSDDEKGLTKEEIEEKDYEQAKLDGESIDEIFADVKDIEDREK